MKPNLSLRRCLFPVLLGALLAAAGCQGVDELGLLASARRHLEAENGEGAALHLKSLLQSRPQSPEARFLLGKALLLTGEAAGAEAELRRALTLGHNATEVVAALADALLAQHKAEQLIKEFGGDSSPAAASADFRTRLALAQAEIGRLETAERTIDTLLARQPSHTAAQLLKARLLAARGAVDPARQLAAELLAREPDNALAWTLQADLIGLANGGGGEEAALEAYRKALALRPRLLPAHAGIVTLLIRRGDLLAARQQFAVMAKALPTSTGTAYFDAVLAHLEGNPRRSLELCRLLLSVSPETPQLLLLASLSELRLGGELQAQAMLEKAISVAPQVPDPRRALARLHLGAGRTTQALDTLRPLLDPAVVDVEALTLAAQAQLLAGDLRQAEVTLARAAAAKPGDPLVRATMARTLLARGQFEPGMRELQAAAAADDEGGSADLLLITTRLRRNELDAAMKAAEALARKQPARPLPDHLRGQVALLQRDTAAARKAYSEALAKDPAFLPSLSRLAELDLAENRPEAARARYEALLAQRPDHVDAMFALARLARWAGVPDGTAASWLNRAVAVRPKDVRVWQTAIELQLRAGNAVSAQALAEKALAANANHPELLQRLAAAQLAASAPQRAIETVARLQKLVPPAAPLHLLLAEAHTAMKDDASARLQVLSALALAPDWMPALRSGVDLALRRGKPNEALAIATEVQRRHPAEAIGFRIEGDVHASRRQWEAAVTALRKAVGKRNPTDSAERLHWALLQAPQPAAAAAFEQEWRRKQPADASFLNHLGEVAMLRNDFPAAERFFRQVLALDTRHVSAANNRAVLAVRARDPQALALAERAAQLAPEHAAVLDTLASAWAQAGQTDTAIAWQLRSVALEPQSGGLRLNLARLYLAAGDRAKARAELEQLTRRGAAFSAAAEVRQLLKVAGG